MEVTIRKSIAKGAIKAPPSKSYGHRYLIASALAGSSTIKGLSFSNDINATLDVLSGLGYGFKNENGNLTSFLKEKENRELNCNESGSTLRFLIPLASLNAPVALTGTEKLFSRGLDVYLNIFKEQGVPYEIGPNFIKIDGKIKPGQFKVPANISSQYITGLLFVLPTLNDDSEIELLNHVESASYIDITLDVLNEFGVKIIREGNIIHVPGRQVYKKQTMTVEGDYSNAAFLDAFNLIRGEVTVFGLNPQSKQGDRVYQKDFLLLKEGRPTIDISDSIDLGPILFAMAATQNGAIFRGFDRLKTKESNRLDDMLSILKEFGVSYKLEDDQLEIFASELKTPQKPIYPANDHRLVMASAVLLSKVGGKISGAEAVNKSYPDFFKDIGSLGVEVSYDR